MRERSGFERDFGAATLIAEQIKMGAVNTNLPVAHDDAALHFLTHRLAQLVREYPSGVVGDAAVGADLSLTSLCRAAMMTR